MRTSSSMMSFCLCGVIAACAPDAGEPGPAPVSARAGAVAGSVTTFPLPAANSFPGSITVGPDGALWFLESGKIGRLTTGGALTEFAAPVSFLAGAITSGPDGALWFTDPGGGTVGRMTTAGAVTQFSLPANRPRHIVDHPQGITTGPDGALWFTVQTISRATLRPIGGKLDRMTTAGALTEHALPAGTTRPTIPKLHDIAVGADGALWFTDSQEGRIWRGTTAGALSSFAVPVGAPTGLTRGPDGAMWFTTTAGTSGRIGRVTTGGAFTEFSVTGGPNGISLSAFLAAGPDGALWTSDYDLTSSSGAILRLTTGGALTPFPFATFDEIDGMTAGRDGAMWFSLTNNQSGASSIGRITTR